MHLDDEILERILHRELEGGGLPAAREHLRGCPACSARLEETRHREARIFGLLERLDEPAPARPLARRPAPFWSSVHSAPRPFLDGHRTRPAADNRTRVR